MVSVQYANAMAEVLYYLKGIRQEDIDKIPKKFMAFLEENASKDYICNFDYYKPLKELELLDETLGIIGVICLNYWCTTPEQKQEFTEILNENERKYQLKLREKYNPDNIFKKPDEIKKEEADYKENSENQSSMVEYKESIFRKIINKIIGKMKSHNN